MIAILSSGFLHNDAFTLSMNEAFHDARCAYSPDDTILISYRKKPIS